MAEAMMEIKEQNPDKREIVKFVTQKLFKSAKDWKWLYAGQNHSKWIEDIKWCKGIHYKNKASDEGKIKAAFNLVWGLIQKELPFMTDRPPKIYIEPMEPDDKYAADIFQMIIANKWVQRDMDKKIPEGTLNCKEVGTAFYRPYWNQDLEGGLGDVDCEVIDPIECFPFPYTNELTKDKTEGFIWARNVSLGWIRKNYPNEGWRVKSMVDNAIVDRAKETAIKSGVGDYVQVGDISTTAGTQSTETDYLPSAGGGDLKATDLQKCTLIKCYLKDGSMQPEDEDEKKPKKAIYPNGRCITIAGGVVLEDEEFAFDFFPGFVEQRNYIQPSEFWGESDVIQIKDINKIYNKIFSMLSEAVRRGVYTQKFIITQSGIEADDYVVTDDATYNTKVSNPVSESQPQALPPQVFNLLSNLQTVLYAIAGTGEYNAPQGGDLPSGRSLAEFNEITQTRLRQKIRNLEYSVRKIGNAWLELMLKNYTEDRVMRLVNSATNESEWCFIFNEKNPQKADMIRQEKMQEIVKGTEQKDPKTGQVVPGSGKKKYNHVLNMNDIKKGFDLTVATGSTVSVSKNATFDQSAMLFKLGGIDKQALLEAADYPNRNDVLKRMNEQAMQTQQAAMQQTQMQAQLEQGKIQVTAQGDQIASQTTLQKTQMDNDTKEKLEALKLAMAEPKGRGKDGM